MSTNSENKTCQNCKNSFVIEPEDFDFYEKIKVPPPTFCPECRMIRRLLWRNEKSLYKKNCITKDGSQDLISNYSKDVPFPVYEESYWWSDEWDPLIYGQEYDFSVPFFEQFKKLLGNVPWPHATNLQCSNSNFCNFTYQSKNCYFVFASDMNEDSAYLHRTLKSKNSFDLEGCENMESCLMSYRSKGCYECSYLYFSTNCINSDLMWDCHNCQSCFGCVNLRNKSYCIFNTQYSKEEYKEKIKYYKDGSYSNLNKNLNLFLDKTIEFPRKFADILQSQNVTGNYIHNSNNCHNCFDVANKVEDCKYISYAFNNTSQCYDMYAGGVNFELGYETMSCGENASNLKMCAMCWTSHNLTYSILCQSSNCFGSIGLRGKEYCILNKQYSKEEYEKLVPEIIKHMNSVPYVDKKGCVYKYGEFFPMELSPFSYNETPAQDFYKKSKTEVISFGSSFKDKDKSMHEATLLLKNIPDSIYDVDESITKEVIECLDKEMDYSPGAFKIIPSELALYRKLGIPLPRKSPQARYRDQQNLNTPMKLWHRKCMKEVCGNAFETSYAPDRPEIVYCEKCYQQEVI